MKIPEKLTVLLLAALLFGCSPARDTSEMTTIRGIVFGTYYTVIYYDEEGTNYSDTIEGFFREFNRSLSFYDENSLLSRINRNEETAVDEYFKVVFERAMEISEETGGAFDVTVFPLVDAWGFGPSERAEMYPEKIDSLLEFVGYQKVWMEDGHIHKADERVRVDFNAIAKGYAVDLVGELLESKGVQVYMVEIGGDLVTRGPKPDGDPWRIGLEVPATTAEAPQEWQYYVEVTNTGLATSGDYRRYYEEDGKRYSHTIDPKTGYPVQHQLMSVSVFAPDGMSADAYATAFMVMGLDESVSFVESRNDLEAYFIYTPDTRDEFAYHATSGLELLTREDL